LEKLLGTYLDPGYEKPTLSASYRPDGLNRLIWINAGHPVGQIAAAD
jgi:hypothetical protein